MADGKIVIQIDGDSGALEKEVSGLGDKVSGSLGKIGETVKDSIGSALSGLADGALSALNKLTGWNGFQSIVTDALDVGMAFENSMSNVASLQKAAGATEAQIKSLKDAAEQFGATTQFTMAECADALGYMALAGWDAEKSISALPGVLNLSAASGMGLAQASNMVTDYMSAFSNSVMTAEQFSDKLAYAQANSNTNVQMLGEAFKNCAANMNSAGQSVDTVTTALGMLANQGKKGSEAGTALSAVMRDLSARMDENNQISIAGNKIDVIDKQTGKYRDMLDIVADIKNVTSSMEGDLGSVALSEVFTADSSTAIKILLNTPDEDLQKFTDGLADCEGAAAEMAKTLNDNLEGDTKALGSAMDAVKNAIYEGLEPALRGIVQTITNNVAPALLDLTKGFFEMLDGVDGAGEKVKSSLGALLNWLTDSAKSVLPNILSTAVDLITKGIPDIVEGVMKVADSVLDVVASLDVGTVIQNGIKNIGDRISHSNVIFRQSAETMISGLIEALPEMVGSVSDIVGEIQKALQNGLRTLKSQGSILIENLIAGVMDGISELKVSLPIAIGNLGEGIRAILPQFAGVGATLIQTLVSGIAENADSLLAFGANLISGTIRSWYNQILGMAEAGEALIDAFIDGISENSSGLWDFVGELVSSLVTQLSGVVYGMARIGSELIQKLCEGFTSGLSALLQTAGSIGEILVNAISTLVPVLLDAGAMLFDAILTGISDNLPDLLEVAESVVMSLFNSIMGALPKLLETGVETVETIVESIMNNVPDLLKTGAEIIVQLVSGIVGALPKLFKTITVMASRLLSTLMGALPELIEVGLDIINILLDGIMQNLPLLIGSAVTLVSDFVRMILENLPLLLDAGFQILQGLLTAIMDNLPLLAESAVSLVMQLVTAILENLPLLIDCALGLVESLVNFITENIPMLLECAFQIVEAIANGILMNLPQILEMGIQVLEKLLEGIVKNIGLIVQAVLKIVNSLAKFFDEHGKDFISMGIQILTMLIQGIGKMLPELIAEALFLIEQFAKMFKDFDWWQLGKDIISLLLTGIKGMYDLAVDATTGLIEKICDTVKEIDWIQLGMDILDGIVNGMKNIGNKISDWGESFVSGLADFFGIHSPSRLMRDEIGRYLGLGIQEGLENSLPDMGRISSELSSDFKPEFTMPEIQKPDLQLEWKAMPEPETVVQASEMGLQEWQMPEFDLPELTAPDFDLPELQVAELAVPEIDLPVLQVEKFDLPELQAPNMPEFRMPDIDFEGLFAKLQFASNVIGASAMPIMTTNNYYHDNSTVENDNRIQNSNTNNGQQGDIIIPVSIGNQEIETFIIDAIQLANMRSGGGFI